jgi:hypothetical protein
MLSTRFNFLYLHVPKTGGNAIQRALIAVSDDRIETYPRQDGWDRFGVVGPFTPRKHAMLEEYRSAGAPLDGLKIAISVRHPFDRALSYYFSPSHWMREERGAWVAHEPRWDEKAFFDSLPKLKPMRDFLAVGGTIRPPDYVIRHETLEHDFTRLVHSLALPVAPTLPGRLNASSVKSELLQELKSSGPLRRSVESIYKADMEMFGY